MTLELTQEQKDAGWQVKKLSECFDIIGGGTPKTSIGEYWGGEIPWLSVTDFSGSGRTVNEAEKSITQLGLDNSSAKVLERGDLIISARGTVGELAQLGRAMAFNQSCYGLRGASGVLTNNYGFYLMKTIVSALRQQSHGSVFSTITRGTFESIEVVIPPVIEQKRVAEILGSIDDKIEANSRLIQSLTELVDARIVKANEHAAETIKVSDLAVHAKEQTLPSKATDGTVLHYSLPAFDAGAVPAEEGAELILSNKFILSKPVVLFSKLNPGTPRIWMIEPDAERFNFASTEFVVLEPKEGVGLGALWAACRDPRVSQKLSEFARGTSSSHQRVSPKDILESSVVVADIPEEETTLIRKLIAENVSLAQVRDLLIRQLIG